MPPEKKLIVIIGATGAQGLAVIDSLLRPSLDGSSSSYSVRALTRDPRSHRAQELARRGIELFKGSVHDLDAILLALQGAYGVFVNTDSFSMGEAKEVFAGIRIYELAKQTGTLRHYVWSSLDNVFKKGNYDPKYYAEHYTGKCRVADWMQAQDSVATDDGMTWSVLTTGPYMEMLGMGVFGPLKVRADGTHVFASPVGAGHVPMIALADLGFFARWIFDHRAETSAKEIEIASDWVGWDYLVSTFTKVTGKKAEYVPLAVDDWVDLFTDTDRPLANEAQRGEGATTWRENFTRWWYLYRDNVIERDFDWLRRLKPDLHTIEHWMRQNAYTGEITVGLLKNDEEGKGGVRPDTARVAEL